MLKFVFGRYSLFVRSLEIIGILLSGYIVYTWTQANTVVWEAALFATLLMHYVFIRFCVLYPWYSGVKSADPETPELGIELHFLKTLVPTSYILCLSAFGILLGLGWLVVPLANLMMIVVSAVNVILIRFHWKDPQHHPINYFTRSLLFTEGILQSVAPGHKVHWVKGKRLATWENPSL